MAANDPLRKDGRFQIWIRRYAPRAEKVLLFDGDFEYTEALRKVENMAGWQSGNITIEPRLGDK